MADCNQDEDSKYKKKKKLKKIADGRKKKKKKTSESDFFFLPAPFVQGRRIRKSGNQLTMNEWMMNDMNDMNDIFFILQ